MLRCRHRSCPLRRQANDLPVVPSPVGQPDTSDSGYSTNQKTDGAKSCPVGKFHANRVRSQTAGEYLTDSESDGCTAMPNDSDDEASHGYSQAHLYSLKVRPEIYLAAHRLAKKYAATGIENVKKGHILALGDPKSIRRDGCTFIKGGDRGDRFFGGQKPRVRVQKHPDLLLKEMNHDGITVIDGISGVVCHNNVFSHHQKQELKEGGARTSASGGLAESAPCVVIMISEDPPPPNGTIRIFFGGTLWCKKEYRHGDLYSVEGNFSGTPRTRTFGKRHISPRGLKKRIGGLPRLDHDTLRHLIMTVQSQATAAGEDSASLCHRLRDETCAFIEHEHPSDVGKEWSRRMRCEINSESLANINWDCSDSACSQLKELLLSFSDKFLLEQIREVVGWLQKELTACISGESPQKRCKKSLEALKTLITERSRWILRELETVVKQKTGDVKQTSITLMDGLIKDVVEKCTNGLVSRLSSVLVTRSEDSVGDGRPADQLTIAADCVPVVGGVVRLCAKLVDDLNIGRTASGMIPVSSEVDPIASASVTNAADLMRLRVIFNKVWELCKDSVELLEDLSTAGFADIMPQVLETFLAVYNGNGIATPREAKAPLSDMVDNMESCMSRFLSGVQSMQIRRKIDETEAHGPGMLIKNGALRNLWRKYHYKAGSVRCKHFEVALRVELKDEIEKSLEFVDLEVAVKKVDSDESGDVKVSELNSAFPPGMPLLKSVVALCRHAAVRSGVVELPPRCNHFCGRSSEIEALERHCEEWKAGVDGNNALRVVQVIAGRKIHPSRLQAVDRSKFDAWCRLKEPWLIDGLVMPAGTEWVPPRDCDNVAEACLKDDNLIFVYPGGGYGKTTVAVEVAQRLSSGDRFPGGVRFFDMRGCETVAIVVDVLASHFLEHDDEAKQMDIDGKCEAVVDALTRGGAFLLVIDNLEGVVLAHENDRSSFVRFLSRLADETLTKAKAERHSHGSGSVVIMTSRVPLVPQDPTLRARPRSPLSRQISLARIIMDTRLCTSRMDVGTEHIVPIGSLTESDSAKMLQRLAGEGGKLNKDQCQAIKGVLLQQVGCLPLALDLAARIMQHQPFLPDAVADILWEKAQEMPHRTELTNYDKLANVIAVVLDQFRLHELDFLVDLALIPGDFGARVATVVLQATDTDVQWLLWGEPKVALLTNSVPLPDLLERFLKAGLVMKNQTTENYMLHNVIRAHILRKWQLEVISRSQAQFLGHSGEKSQAELEVAQSILSYSEFIEFDFGLTREKQPKGTFGHGVSEGIYSEHVQATRIEWKISDTMRRFVTETRKGLCSCPFTVEGTSFYLSLERVSGYDFSLGAGEIRAAVRVVDLTAEAVGFVGCDNGDGNLPVGCYQARLEPGTGITILIEEREYETVVLALIVCGDLKGFDRPKTAGGRIGDTQVTTPIRTRRGSKVLADYFVWHMEQGLGLDPSLQAAWDVDMVGSRALDHFNPKREFPMHMAVSSNNAADEIRRLANARCMVHPRNLDGATPLHLACRHINNISAIEALMEYPEGRASLCMPDDFGNIPAEDFERMTLREKERVCRVEGDSGARQLFERCDALLKNMKDILVMNSQLMRACKEGNAWEVQHIVHRTGTEETSMTNDAGQTSLHIACISGSVEVVNALLSAGGLESLANIKDVAGRTPLHHACAHGHRQVVEYLLSDPCVHMTEVDCAGFTPLILACRAQFSDLNHEQFKKPCTEVVEEMMKQYALRGDVGKALRQKTRRGWTPLLFACRCGLTTAVEILLRCPEAVETINWKGIFGGTARTRAANDEINTLLDDAAPGTRDNTRRLTGFGLR